MTAERAPKPAVAVGSAEPRLAPPVPARSLVKEYEESARAMGIKLMPWQKTAGRYLTATNGKAWTYREVCIVVARQNGKTTALLPLIRQRLLAGRKILHTAQNRSLPRETFLALAQHLSGHPDVVEVRYANGQEVIRVKNGGRYSLVAPTRSGARGHGVDDVILDEVREQHDFDLVASIKPALTASKNSQIIYISNAGDAESVVLNDLRRRKDAGGSLAYLEWSVPPELPLDDEAGWGWANPALGITIQLETLRDFFTSFPAAVFETEHACRWVISTRPRVIADAAWELCHAEVERPSRPAIGISMDATGRRASAVLAWQQRDGKVACRLIADVNGDPIDTERLGTDLAKLALRSGVAAAGFDDWTDKDLARYLKTPRSITGREYANACENFARIVESGRLRWDVGEQIGADLEWTARKPSMEGTWMAVKADEGRSITAALAAIRATWLASAPKPAAPRVL